MKFKVESFPGGRAVGSSSRFAAAVLFVFLFNVCTTLHSAGTDGSRRFSFAADTLAYPNELVWEYYFDDRGKWTNRKRRPEPSYTHRCFVVARSARQFFEHARFDPSLPIADQETYRRLIKRVVSISPRRRSSDTEKIVIPGYANLKEFSHAQEPLLKAEAGGAWRSYFQRGHWRMMVPFTRHHQEAMANQLAEAIRANHPPVVHLVTFPKLTINHAVLLLDVAEFPNELRFTVYDPNRPETPRDLVFDSATRTFHFPANDYFIGGPINVYEVYHSWNY